MLQSILVRTEYFLLPNRTGTNAKTSTLDQYKSSRQRFVLIHVFKNEWLLVSHILQANFYIENNYFHGDPEEIHIFHIQHPKGENTH